MELASSMKILLALGVGAAIGLERELHQKKDHHKNRSGALIGVRTFALTTLLGAIAGLLNSTQFVLSSVIATTFLMLTIINYGVSSYISRDTGITTELAAILSFIIGFLIAVTILPTPVVLSIAVVLMLILAYKEQVKDVVEVLHVRELKALLSYAIIAVVILPFLPNTSLTVGSIPYLSTLLRSNGIDSSVWNNIELINPFKTWLIVAIITGVDLVGYILEKMVGKSRGIAISSLIGGFVSSTATTQSLAASSRKSAHINEFLSASFMATGASYISLFLVIMPLHPTLTLTILPTFAILLISFGIAAMIFLPVRTKPSVAEIEHPQKNAIFSVKPAMIFALVFILVKLLTSTALLIFGSSGFLLTSALSGISGVDAVTINIADLSKNTISMTHAIQAFILVNAVNLVAKTFYIFIQGARVFAVKYGVIVSAIILLSTIGLLFV